MICEHKSKEKYMAERNEFCKKENDLVARAVYSEREADLKEKEGFKRTRDFVRKKMFWCRKIRICFISAISKAIFL